ncbi:transcription antiterminator [Caloramator sp. E03]|uniref:BglG family transcription antiterminator n=1 Tax=Caloramator sp. E03 TaxID=2576307 RepID=UPI001110EC84|nr:transcription antiterminator [Caloramator sp. E03]QCX32917.1 transcription antiterminator [Caloramator sp. E03]
MESLTVRQKFILNSLIEKGPLDIKGLSQQIDVSDRTILREISSINSFIKQYNLRISDCGGKIQLNGSTENIEKVKKMFDEIPLLWMLTQEQRQLLITAQLLLAKEPIKAAFFSYQFNVVEGTITFYLDKIESYLKLKNLELIRKRGYGIQVIGSEWNKRNAFVELLYDYNSIIELLSYLYEDSNDYMLNSFFKITFGDDLILKAKNIIKEFYNNKNILKDNDISYFSAFIHILLSIERTENNMAIELPEHFIKNAFSLKGGNLAKSIDEIFIKNGIKLPEGELAYLAIHLNGDENINLSENKENMEFGFDIEDLINEIINIVSKRLNIYLHCDNQLMAGLKQHLNPAIYRLTLGLEIRNPVINEIREYYRELFDTVEYACKLVFSKYNISVPYSEVGYITMHIGAAIERQSKFKENLKILIVCPNGISTAKILCNKIKNRFPEINEIDVCSLREMDEKIKEDYDIILSTVEINKKYENIAVISPFLQNDDVEKINSLIKAKSEGKNIKNLFIPFYKDEKSESRDDFILADDILKNFRLRNISGNSINDVIIKIVDDLYKSNTINKKEIVEYQIRKREEKGSVVVPGSHTALIHIRTEEIESPYLGAYRLENFIEMNGVGVVKENVDTILVMLARKNESSYILETLGKISIAMVQDNEFTKALRFGDIIDIRNKLVDIINKEEM